MKEPRVHRGLMAAVFLAVCATSLPRGNEYLDPGTGSYVFQVVVGTLLGVAVAVKMSWRRMTGFVLRRTAKSQQRPKDD